MSPYRRRRPDPNRILAAQLSGLVIRLAEAGGSVDDSVAELRALADGRGDLLAREAGLSIGFALVRPVTEALPSRGSTAGAGRGGCGRAAALGRDRSAASVGTDASGMTITA
jgi:hypothetical protein